jgi:hypothetical protein
MLRIPKEDCRIFLLLVSTTLKSSPCNILSAMHSVRNCALNPKFRQKDL